MIHIRSHVTNFKDVGVKWEKNLLKLEFTTDTQ